jgi:hypothetical protein
MAGPFVDPHDALAARPVRQAEDLAGDGVEPRKLGVGRRAAIAAWTASRPVLHSRPHGSDREE